MKPRNQVCIGLVSGLSFSLLILSGHAVTAQVANGKSEKQTPRPESWQTNPNVYQRALTLYMAGIEKEARNRQIQNVKIATARTKEEKQRELWLRQNESNILSQLRQRYINRNKRPLDFDGEVLENEVLLPTSSISARIFTRLVKEGVVIAGDLAYRLRTSEANTGWQPVLLSVFHAAPKGSVPWNHAVQALYCVTGDPQYRRLLQKMAIDNHDVDTVKVLFNRPWVKSLIISQGMSSQSKAVADTATFKDEKKENDKLLSQFVSHETNPEVLVYCAQYALNTGNKKLAESACVQVLRQQYLRPYLPASQVTQEDLALSRAKDIAMTTLFYDVRTAHGFEEIYRRSQLIEEFRKEKNSENANLTTLLVQDTPEDSILVRSEVDFARRLVSSVVKFDRTKENPTNKRNLNR